MSAVGAKINFQASPRVSHASSIDCLPQLLQPADLIVRRLQFAGLGPRAAITSRSDVLTAVDVDLGAVHI